MALNLDTVCFFGKVALNYSDLGSIPFSNANKIMAALSRVLEESWKLGLMSAEDYHRAIATERKTGQRLLKGRALSIREVQALFKVSIISYTIILISSIHCG